MTFPVPGGATFLRARSNLADVASSAAALANLGGLSLVASTGLGGFALQNALPTMLTWNVPNDGNVHRFFVPAIIAVSAGETGGAINTGFILPDGSAGSFQNSPGGLGTGTRFPTSPIVVCKPGTTVTIAQSSALTAGAAVVWAEIWGL